VAPLEATWSDDLAACTIFASNYLSFAKTLVQSFRLHHPRSRFYLLIVDNIPDGFEFDADVIVVRPEEIAGTEFRAMCFQYSVIELATSLKPRFLSLLLNTYQEQAVVYLDPDVLVLKALAELPSILSSSNIVITPHILKPTPRDGRYPDDKDLLQAGAYNLGFIAVSRSSETTEFLNWWDQHLRDDCVLDLARGLFYDQKWIDLVPGLFGSTYILRDQTYNVAFWNLHERAIERTDSTYLINGRPMTFFHFSGFEPAKPKFVSKHQNRIDVQPGSGLADLINWYAYLQRQNGFDVASRLPYSYSTFNNGSPIEPSFRRRYRSLDVQSRIAFGDPFEVNGPNTFFKWIITSTGRTE
jgi:hypothetical protein